MFPVCANTGVSLCWLPPASPCPYYWRNRESPGREAIANGLYGEDSYLYRICLGAPVVPAGPSCPATRRRFESLVYGDESGVGPVSSR